MTAMKQALHHRKKRAALEGKNMNANTKEMNKLNVNDLSMEDMEKNAGGEGGADLHALYVKLATKVILIAKEKYGKFFTLERAKNYLDFAANDFYIPKNNIPQVKEAMPDAWTAMGLTTEE